MYIALGTDVSSVPWVGGREDVGLPLMPAASEGRQARLQRVARRFLAATEDVPEEDVHLVARIEDHDVNATLVNVVYLSTLRPRVGPPTSVSLAMLYQSLVGVASFGYKTNGNLELTFKTRAPFRAKHSFTPIDMRLQETAATSDTMGLAVLEAVVALMGEGTTGGLDIRGRYRTNEVYTAYLPFHLDMEAIDERLPKVTRVPERFVGRILEPPDRQIKLLVFPKGSIICVGSCHSAQMLATMRRYLPDFRAAAVGRGTKRARPDE
jgi:hypothetical protein